MTAPNLKEQILAEWAESDARKHIDGLSVMSAVHGGTSFEGKDIPTLISEWYDRIRAHVLEEARDLAEGVIRSDRTKKYEYGEVNGHGEKPSSGGRRWATPTEIAGEFLRNLSALEKPL